MSPPTPSLFATTAKIPLAERLRPSKLEDVVGQEHLLAPDAPLGRMMAAGRLASLILWGPPGCGKTTIARLLASAAHLHFEPVSATASGVADLRRVFEAATARRASGAITGEEGTLLFVDEVHRFNRAQQDVLLPFVEDGTVTLVGATTENPSFELNGALLSRCQVLVLKRLDEAALEALLQRAETEARHGLPLLPEARITLSAMADGDGRYLLVMADELLAARAQKPDMPPLSSDDLVRFVQRRPPLYDKAQDSHYNLISALHKSLRSSDCDAALYWLARMLEGGDDPRYIARRLTRFASEDVGMADSQALPMTIAAWEAYERMGSPEGELALAEAVVYLATAPKSNATYLALGEARTAARNSGSLMPPKHILNAPTKMMKEQGYGAGYVYDHDTEAGFSGQNCFPDDLPRRTFYRPVPRGFEREVCKRLEYWEKLRNEKRT